MGVVDDKGDEGFTRLTLEIPAPDAELFRALAAYRNALASAQGKTLRKQWTRKMMAESAISAQADSIRQQLAPMFEACGPFPVLTGHESRDEKAMREYAARVLAWDKRISGAGK